METCDRKENGLAALYLPIVVTIAIFIVALAIDQAIITSFRWMASRNETTPDVERVVRKNMIYLWIFVIVVIVIAAVLIYFARNYMPSAFRTAGEDIPEDLPEGLSAAFPEMPTIMGV